MNPAKAYFLKLALLVAVAMVGFHIVLLAVGYFWFVRILEFVIWLLMTGLVTPAEPGAMFGSQGLWVDIPQFLLACCISLLVVFGLELVCFRLAQSVAIRSAYWQRCRKLLVFVAVLAPLMASAFYLVPDAIWLTEGWFGGEAPVDESPTDWSQYNLPALVISRIVAGVTQAVCLAAPYIIAGLAVIKASGWILGYEMKPDS